MENSEIVVTGPTSEIIIAYSSIKDVIPKPGIEDVITALTKERNRTFGEEISIEGVIAFAARQ